MSNKMPFDNPDARLGGLTAAQHLAATISALLSQNYRKVDNEWCLFNGNRFVRTLSGDEVNFHIVNNHFPFVDDGVRDSFDPRWWGDDGANQQNTKP